MWVENNSLIKNLGNSPETLESYNYKEALELTQKIHAWMDQNWYNHEQYGINPNTWVVFANDWKIKILVNEKAQPIDTGFTTNDYSTNKFWSFTIFKISERIRSLEKQYETDLKSVSGWEIIEIKKNTTSQLSSFISEQVEKWYLTLTYLKNKAKQKIDTLSPNEQIKEQDTKQINDNKWQNIQVNINQTTTTKIDNSTFDSRNYTWYMYSKSPIQFKQPEQVKTQSAEEVLNKYRT